MTRALCLLLVAWLAIVVAFGLAGCAEPLRARQGQPVAGAFPQADEQCLAQPELDWCAAARRVRHEGR